MSSKTNQTQTTETKLSDEEAKAKIIESNGNTLNDLYQTLQATVKSWMASYQEECREMDVAPEVTLNDVTEAEINQVVTYLLHSQGVRTQGTVKRNMAEKVLLYYPAFAVGTVAGAIDSMMTHVPGYSKNVKAGFSAGMGFGHFVERKLFEGAKEKCSSTKEKLTQAYETRKKAKADAKEEESTLVTNNVNTPVPSPA